MAQDAGPEFKPQYCQKKKKNLLLLAVLRVIWLNCRLSHRHHLDLVEEPRLLAMVAQGCKRLEAWN
jgi:hypothetical protein